MLSVAETFRNKSDRICRRINKLDIKINYDDDDDVTKSSLHDDNFVIAIDSTVVLKLQTEVNGLGTNGK